MSEMLKYALQHLTLWKCDVNNMNTIMNGNIFNLNKIGKRNHFAQNSSWLRLSDTAKILLKLSIKEHGNTHSLY